MRLTETLISTIYNRRFMHALPHHSNSVFHSLFIKQVLLETVYLSVFNPPEHEAKLVPKSIYSNRNRSKNYQVLHQLIKTPSFSPIFHTLVSLPPFLQMTVITSFWDVISLLRVGNGARNTVSERSLADSVRVIQAQGNFYSNSLLRRMYDGFKYYWTLMGSARDL